jgi:hypothetical protein
MSIHLSWWGKKNLSHPWPLLFFPIPQQIHRPVSCTCIQNAVHFPCFSCQHSSPSHHRTPPRLSYKAEVSLLLPWLMSAQQPSNPLKKKKSQHASLLFKLLQWLPISQRIKRESLQWFIRSLAHISVLMLYNFPLLSCGYSHIWLTCGSWNSLANTLLPWAITLVIASAWHSFPSERKWQAFAPMSHFQWNLPFKWGHFIQNCSLV